MPPSHMTLKPVGVEAVWISWTFFSFGTELREEEQIEMIENEDTEQQLG